MVDWIKSYVETNKKVTVWKCCKTSNFDQSNKWLHDTSISLFQYLEMIINCHIFLLLWNGKFNCKINKEIPQKMPKDLINFKNNTSNMGFLINSALFDFKRSKTKILRQNLSEKKSKWFLWSVLPLLRFRIQNFHL